MKAYQIMETYQYEGTLADAHKEAKRLVKEGDFKDWRDVAIEEVEVRTDKAGVLALLNECAIIEHTGRRWEFASKKLGLEEVTDRPKPSLSEQAEEVEHDQA